MVLRILEDWNQLY